MKLILNELQQKYRAPLKIVNPLTALQLFEFGFDKLNENETQSKAEIEANLFKAILFQNQANTQAQQLAFDSTAQIPMPARIPVDISRTILATTMQDSAKLMI